MQGLVHWASLFNFFLFAAIQREANCEEDGDGESDRDRGRRRQLREDGERELKV